jgi:hypothetical protein
MILFFTCSGKPSVGEIINQIDNLFKASDYAGYVKIRNFEKLNGYEQDKNTYLVEIKYDLVFTKSSKEIENAISQKNKPQDSTDDMTAFAKAYASMQQQAYVGNLMLNAAMRLGEYQSGATYPVQETITLIKTDNGWCISQPPSLYESLFNK